MISERHAAAARADGAKSRGPVTARSKANASRNSLRHGLRAKTFFDDGKLEDERRAILRMNPWRQDPFVDAKGCYQQESNPARPKPLSEWCVTHPESCNENAVFGELRSR